MKNFISLLLLFMISTGVAQAQQTVSPPIFDPDPSELEEGEVFPEYEYFEIYSEDGGTIYYQIDPSPAPTTPADVKANGKPVYESYGETWVEFSLKAGEHTIYAIVEIDGVLSEIASATYTVYKELAWSLVTNIRAITPYNKYIILNRDRTMVAGSFENGHFNALPCENNLTFDPYYGTLDVNSDDVKVFTFDDFYDAENYIKDSKGTYYTLGENEVSTGKSQVYVNVPSSYPRVVKLSGSEGGVSLSFDENFGMYANGRPVVMYYLDNLTLANAVKYKSRFIGNGQIAINDDLLAVKYVEYEGSHLLWCKDLGNSAVDKTENADPDNIPDYMKAYGFFNSDWDQSNWIRLYCDDLLDGDEYDKEAIKSLEGKIIKGGSIYGWFYDSGLERYIDLDGSDGSIRPEVAEGSQPINFKPNVFSPANFLSTNHEGNATAHDENGNPTDQHYFFVNPKLEELCEITYAVWNGEYFVMPAPEGEYNPDNVYGYFEVSWEYNEYGDVSEELEVGQMYKFYGIVEHYYYDSTIHSAPRRVESVTPGDFTVDPDHDGNYIVYPVDLYPQEHIITGVDKVKPAGNGVVKSVKYVSVAGVVSNTPFQGVNIVVTEYTDGSRTTSKIISK